MAHGKLSLSGLCFFYELLAMNYEWCVKFFFLTASNILLLTSLSAQADSAKFLTDTTTLESVTVTAFGSNAKWKDAPAAVALINQKQLQRFDNKTLVPVLNTVAGV